jgi:hypothetical protein
VEEKFKEEERLKKNVKEETETEIDTRVVI